MPSQSGEHKRRARKTDPSLPPLEIPHLTDAQLEQLWQDAIGTSATAVKWPQITVHEKKKPSVKSEMNTL